MNKPSGGFNRAERFEQSTHIEPYTETAFTITARAGGRPTDNYIQIPEATKRGYKEAYEGDEVYLDRPHQKRGVVQDGMIQTLKTSGNDVGVVVDGYDDLRIRKLTPVETGRLWV